MGLSVFDNQYVVKETTISVVFNTAFSSLFAWFVFSNEVLIYSRQLLLDAPIQSFFVTFFSVFVPTVLTRKRMSRSGFLVLSERRSLLPFGAFFRSIYLGVIVALLSFVFHYLLFFVVSLESINFTVTLMYKAFYGAFISCLITTWALLSVLSERDYRVSSTGD